ncbi:hypothetical protein QOT17_002846 [Balamuthia mandrillaris]
MHTPPDLIFLIFNTKMVGSWLWSGRSPVISAGAYSTKAIDHPPDSSNLEKDRRCQPFNSLNKAFLMPYADIELDFCSERNEAWHRERKAAGAQRQVRSPLGHC